MSFDIALEIRIWLVIAHGTNEQVLPSYKVISDRMSDWAMRAPSVT